MRQPTMNKVTPPRLGSSRAHPQKPSTLLNITRCQRQTGKTLMHRRKQLTNKHFASASHVWKISSAGVISFLRAIPPNAGIRPKEYYQGRV